MNNTQWPSLDYNNWKDTLSTLDLYTQVVGKIRLKSMPWLNHSWHVTLYVTPKGLTTGSMNFAIGIFEIQFNFIRHVLEITTSTGFTEEFGLQNISVAQFYTILSKTLYKAGIDVIIYAVPNEIEKVIPFAQDDVHKTYNGAQVHTYWQALVQVHKVFTRFRAGFCGKCSPVHFFWGAFDLAVTRFSGKSAPLYSGGTPHMPLRVMQEAYSHEVSSAGFWPGSDALPYAAFYAYCYPAPAAFGEQPVQPAAAFFDKNMGEFILKYDVVQAAADPEAILLQFLHTTYDAAANTGNWNRAALECDLASFENKLSTKTKQLYATGDMC